MTQAQLHEPHTTTQNNPAKVLVALSGGVDSAVAALLLKQQGYAVSAVFMQNWEADHDDPYCSADQDLRDAQAVAHQLNIPLETVNFSREYWQHVFQHCLDEFSRGRTPNPDVLCNREIKFKALLQYALAQGADYLATGHYAGIMHDHDEWQLIKGNDPTKDQSYFLYLLNQEALSHSLFPLATLKKKEVRQLAKTAALPNFDKADSTGICFIGERKFSTFLKEFLLTKPGPIKTLDGQTIGQHSGLMFYTLGQRQGLGIGGIKGAEPVPWYVVGKHIEHNCLIVGQGHNHPQLFSSQLIAQQWFWRAQQKPKIPFSCTARTRYQQRDQSCQITQWTEDQVAITFDQPQRAITPGQSVVCYQGEVCLGGGIITEMRVNRSQ